MLVPGRKIAGVIFPALDRLSREPIHIGIFEFELDHFGVKYHYADAPNGSDPMSQMVRQNLAHAAKFVKLANRKNNRGGNIGRVLKGLAPAHRAAFGYRYYADKVPALVSTELWQKANANVTERGRGRGKQGRSLKALLRGRILCPKCGKPMVVRRGGHQGLVYYHCSRYYQPWVKEPCNYRRFIPGTWEDLVWQDICAWLRDDAWVEPQLASKQSQDENVEN